MGIRTSVGNNCNYTVPGLSEGWTAILSYSVFPEFIIQRQVFVYSGYVGRVAVDDVASMSNICRSVVPGMVTEGMECLRRIQQPRWGGAGRQYQNPS
jgi:hypothetical protein